MKRKCAVVLLFVILVTAAVGNAENMNVVDYIEEYTKCWMHMSGDTNITMKVDQVTHSDEKGAYLIYCGDTWIAVAKDSLLVEYIRIPLTSAGGDADDVLRDALRTTSTIAAIEYRASDSESVSKAVEIYEAIGAKVIETTNAIKNNMYNGESIVCYTGSEYSYLITIIDETCYLMIV